MRFASLALFALALAGCASDRPAATFEFPVEVVQRERPAPDAGPQAAALVDADGLRAALARAVPPGWAIQEPDDQIDAPAGWERIDGARGMAIKVVDRRLPRGKTPEPYFTLYLFPHGWTGRDVAQGFSIEADELHRHKQVHPELAAADPVVFYGASRDWLFFHSTRGHAPGSPTTVAAGWNKPEDDVARALDVRR